MSVRVVEPSPCRSAAEAAHPTSNRQQRRHDGDRQIVRRLCRPRCRQSIQRTSAAEPVKLRLVQSMPGFHLPNVRLTVVHNNRDRSTHAYACTQDIDAGMRSHVPVVFAVHQRQRQYPLLLQICLMDPSKGSSDNGEATKVSNLQRCMLAR